MRKADFGSIPSFMPLKGYPPPNCKVLLAPMGRREPTHLFDEAVQCEHGNGRQSIHLVSHSAHGHKHETAACMVDCLFFGNNRVTYYCEIINVYNYFINTYVRYYYIIAQNFGGG